MSDEKKTKPGWRTTEFWLSSIAVVLGAALSSGILPSEGPWAKLVGAALAALTALGYTAARTKAKGG